jgi:hypothetical protein
LEVIWVSKPPEYLGHYLPGHPYVMASYFCLKRDGLTGYLRNYLLKDASLLGEGISRNAKPESNCTGIGTDASEGLI